MVVSERFFDGSVSNRSRLPSSKQTTAAQSPAIGAAGSKIPSVDYGARSNKNGYEAGGVANGGAGGPSSRSKIDRLDQTISEERQSHGLSAAVRFNNRYRCKIIRAQAGSSTAECSRGRLWKSTLEIEKSNHSATGTFFEGRCVLQLLQNEMPRCFVSRLLGEAFVSWEVYRIVRLHLAQCRSSKYPNAASFWFGWICRRVAKALRVHRWTRMMRSGVGGLRENEDQTRRTFSDWHTK